MIKSNHFCSWQNDEFGNEWQKLTSNECNISECVHCLQASQPLPSAYWLLTQKIHQNPANVEGLLNASDATSQGIHVSDASCLDVQVWIIQPHEQIVKCGSFWLEPSIWEHALIGVSFEPSKHLGRNHDLPFLLRCGSDKFNITAAKHIMQITALSGLKIAFSQ